MGRREIELWGASLCSTVIAVLIAMLIPSINPVLGWTLVAVFAAIGIGLFLAAIFPVERPLVLWMWRLEFRGPFPFRRLIPLGKAANVALRKLGDHKIAGLAKSGAKLGLSTPVQSMAALLIKNGQVSVYGRKDQWSALSVVPESAFSAPILHDCSSVGWLEDGPQYIDLAMARSDLKKRIDALKRES